MPEALLAKAKKEIQLADHLIYVTYPLIKEAKFLLSIAEHVAKAAEMALEALLAFERAYKRIEPFADNFSVRIDVFQEKARERLGFGVEHVRLLKRLAEFREFERESVMRFRRGDKYILASQQYNTHELDLDKVKRLCTAAKNFIDKVGEVIR